jgi:transposase
VSATTIRASQRRVTWVGLDVSKDTIAVGVLGPRDSVPIMDKIAHDEVSIRRLVGRLGEPGRLKVCYEAGPTGYELQRLLASMGVACDVVAPSLVPVASGDRVKTDQRDSRRLVRLYRAGELVAVRVPTQAEEGCRDLCRLRGKTVWDRRRARQRLQSLLLRRGLIFRDSTAWTIKHRQWLRSLHFEEPALAATFAHMLAMVEERELRVGAIEADLSLYQQQGLFADQVRRLAAYRGIDVLGGLTLACEVCDWRRFPSASRFMGFVGLVPSEYSSGATQIRGRITKAGNAHVRYVLIEAAWAYQRPARVGVELHRRHQDLTPEVVARSWAAQVRLCGRFRRLAARKDRSTVVATAVARELWHGGGEQVVLGGRQGVRFDPADEGGPVTVAVEVNGAQAGSDGFPTRSVTAARPGPVVALRGSGSAWSPAVRLSVVSAASARAFCPGAGTIRWTRCDGIVSRDAGDAVSSCQGWSARSDTVGGVGPF